MGVFLVIQVIVCVLLIGAVLLQVGRGASTGASFGGGSGAFFGPAGEVSFLGKVIVVLSVLFVVNTVLLYAVSRQAPPALPPGQEEAPSPSGQEVPSPSGQTSS